MEPETKKAFVIDSLKVLEIYELQEEEKYLFNLKLQSDKIEEFRSELSNKTARITSLEAELETWQKKKSEFEKLSLEVVYLAKDLKEKELEIDKLKATLNSQTNEYDSSILELNQVVLKERQEKANEIEKLKAELLTAEDDLEAVVEALETTKKTLLVFQKKYENEVILNKEIENNANEQVKIWKNSEKALKDEIQTLKQENLAQKEVIRGFTDQVNKKKYLNEEIEQALSEERKKNKELAKKIEEINEKYEKSKENVEDEFESLKDELDQAIEIITRQESSLQDLRIRKQEDDTKIFGLSKELETKETEILKHQKMITKLNKNDQEKIEKIEDLEFKVRSLTNENSRLKAELQCIYDKQDKDRDERKKIAKKKIDLLTQRNQEILRLNQAFGTLDS